MHKAKNIKNLESLDREIYRLQLEARKMEDRLENNFDHLQENFSSFFMNSVFRRKQREKENGQTSSFWKNEKFNFIIEKVSDMVATKVAGGISGLVDRIFHKEK